jgi:hypothetical protein
MVIAKWLYQNPSSIVSYCFLKEVKDKKKVFQSQSQFSVGCTTNYIS